MNWTKHISNNVALRSNKSLITALMTFLLLGIILIRYYQYQLNPDGLVYIKIAKIYLMGDYGNAISAYWSPLISWLLIPFLVYGINPVYVLFSTKVLALIIGFFTLLGIGKLSYKFEMNNTIRTVILFSAVPVVLYFAYSVITPDLLLVCILVYYFNIIFDSEYPNKLSNGLLCGLLGALAYLSKSYAFPFFIAHFTLFNIIHYFKNIQNRKKVLKNLFIGFAVFFVISGIWIGLISQKEGEITYSTSGEFNHNLVGPESKGWGMTHYLGEVTSDGSLTPSADVKSWSPFESWSNFKHQLKLIYTNTIDTISIYKSFSYFSLIILFVYLMFFLKPFKKILKDNRIYPILTVIIFSVGYLPILVEERYLWAVYILLFLMGGYLVNELFKHSFFTTRRKSIILLVFALSFIWMPVSFLSENINLDKEIYNMANFIEDQYSIHGNIAVNQDNKKIAVTYLSYYLGTTYLGQTNNTSSSQLQEQLKKYNVDFYIVWGDNNSVLNGYAEVTNGKINALKIYSINDKVQVEN
ncbi:MULTISPECIES: hypothetical protein [Methanobacterium]|uniref:Glycosyltransferase RgtA/B/C/D-like domain-containing protein n=2 Tax=Methanobacterium veterum TaxID=408577 RepID=A0A9E5DMY0_9EURY|nr:MULTISPECIES: hypothetical protein [Methanobacterium]MCZ3367195.1 hypothetical protein [Methanobacterium veterum]